MEICSVEGGMQNDDLYSDDGDSDESSSEEGLNASGKCRIHVHPHNTTCKYMTLCIRCLYGVHALHTTGTCIEYSCTCHAYFF